LKKQNGNSFFIEWTHWTCSTTRLVDKSRKMHGILRYIGGGGGSPQCPVSRRRPPLFAAAALQGGYSSRWSALTRQSALQIAR
jgi:hypothetical protein